MLEAPTRNAGANLKRRAPPRRLLALSLVALAAALVTCLWLLAMPRGQARALPDGSRVTLESVTFGRHHSFDPRPWWERLLNGQPPPPRQRAGFPPNVNTSTNSVVVWLSQEAAGGRRAAIPSHGVLTDAHGCPFAPSSVAVQPAFRARPNALLHTMVFEAYPRRDPFVRLEVSDPRSHSPAAALDLSVPAMQTFPTWEASVPTPVAIPVGEVVFTLQSLIHRDDRHLREEAVFRITRNGKSITDWRPSRVTVRDATGNAAVTRCQGLPGYGKVFFVGLCRRETAWKLAVTFERIHSGRVLETRTVEFVVKP